MNQTQAPTRKRDVIKHEIVKHPTDSKKNTYYFLGGKRVLLHVISAESISLPGKREKEAVFVGWNSLHISKRSLVAHLMWFGDIF